jgi:nitronate monooxygenase
VSVITDLGVDLPVLAAPMAGGPGTPALVIAAAAAGSLGFLAAGYKTPDAVVAEIAEVRAVTDRFGVNVFAPNPLPVDPAEFRQYAAAIQADAERYGVDLSRVEPVEDDDHWRAKIDLLVADPVPIVSFTFGVPTIAEIRALQQVGTVVVQTVTATDEAAIAADRGVDALAIQSAAAGGHSGTLQPTRRMVETPLTELVAQVAAVVNLPVFAAGGLASPADVVAVIRAGALAAVVGTALLRTPESGASPTHRAALADPRRESVLTHAFTGRPARGLRNDFIDRHEAHAPLGYPALHHLTSPLRKASAAAGDPERMNLWAGTGFRRTTENPTGTVLAMLGNSL